MHLQLNTKVLMFSSYGPCYQAIQLLMYYVGVVANATVHRHYMH